MLLVTGITGLTGRFLYELLIKDGITARFLVRETGSYKELQKVDSAHFVTGDVSKAADIAAVLDNVDTVIHLVNIRYSPQIIEACKMRNIKRVIFVNTTSVYSKYQSAAGKYKELEANILSSGLDYTVIRPTMIYGNGQDKNIHKLIKLADRLPVFPIVGKGNHLMQPIYAGDAAWAIYKAYKKGETSLGKCYNIAGKEPLSYLELIKEIGAALGKNLRLIHVPYGIALAIGRLGDLIPNGLITYEKIQRLAEDKFFDYSDAVRDLDFAPMSFTEGVRKEVASLKEAGVLI